MINKQQIAHYFDTHAPERMMWFRKNHLYHEQVLNVCRLFINEDSRVLELGCSTGGLLASLGIRHGVGVDISPVSIKIAQQNFPDLTWICADVEDLPDHAALAQPFDLIIIEDLLSYLNDIEQFLRKIRKLTHANTRLVISTWNQLWSPILQVGEKLRLKSPSVALKDNWLSPSAIETFLDLTHYQVLKIFPGLLLPYTIPLVTPLVNMLSYAPVIERLTLLSTLVALPRQAAEETAQHSVSVIIPTRNEVQNIAALVERTPRMGSHTEIIFVDGNSTDGTVEAIQHQIKAHPQKDIKFMPQVPAMESDTPPNLMLKLGKGDAVRKGFEKASGDIVMILDSDLSVMPEDLPKFYEVLATGKADFANGTRFIYRQEYGAMRTLNRLGNIFFSLLFSWLLGQRITDTLCGTKALYKRDYQRVAANRHQFGEFDPFGDFDLLFNAAWLKLRITDVPVRYLARTYGESKVRVGKHGQLLIRMSLIAFWHFKLKKLFRSLMR